MTLNKGKLKRMGQVVVTSLMIGVYAATSLSATSGALAEQIDTTQLGKQLTSITQTVASESIDLAGEGLSMLLGINTTHASSTDYSATEAKVDAILVGFFAKIEAKNMGDTAEIALYQKVVDKIAVLKQSKGSTLKASTAHLIDYLGQGLQTQIDSYKVYSTPTKTVTPIGQTTTTSTVAQTETKTVEQTEVKTPTQVNAPVYNESSMNGVALSHPEGDLDVSNLGIYTKSRDVTKAIGSYVYGDVEDELMIPGVIATGKTKAEIQAFTQKYNAQNTSVPATSLGLVPMTVELRDGTTRTISGLALGEDALLKSGDKFDAIKYHYAINGVIERGTQKYEDYKKDYFDEQVGAMKGDTFIVRLEKLPLGSTFQKKLDNFETFTSAELVRLWETGLAMEGLENDYSIIEITSKKFVDGKIVFSNGYRVIDNTKGEGSFSAVMEWGEDGHKMPVTSYLSGAFDLSAYLFSR